MSERKLTATEISERHDVSERTAYRWLADGDPRTYDETVPSQSIKPDRLPELKMRALLFDRYQAGLWLFVRKTIEEGDAPPVFAQLDELYRTRIGPALQELYRLAGLQTADDTEE
jgi:hypothetical protein